MGNAGYEENKRYEKLGELGQGAYGKVHKVRNNRTGEECVMKIISVEEIDRDAFQNEVVLMKKINTLSSPCLVKYITSDVREKEYQIIMEYCSGEV